MLLNPPNFLVLDAQTTQDFLSSKEMHIHAL
jgi:hypothetical protein